MNVNENHLTKEQFEALKAYAGEHGRRWKSDLRDEWMTATAPWPLMQVRNQFGPTWLVRFRFPQQG
jgi:hypothetical protein